MKQSDEPRLWQFRIMYRVGESVDTNYHYYLAENAAQALEFQDNIAEHHQWDITTISIERKCPWANKWLIEEINK